ncbi:MAG: hypothetical protein WDA09_05085 [Bacteriovoracaceae bacterium]
MFTKMMSIMLVFAVFTVSAQATTQNGLKAAFDELNYALTVEWDQQDKNFYIEQMKSFKSKVNELQAQGLSNKELIEFAKSEVKNKKLAADLDTAFSMISLNRMTSEQASEYLVDLVKKGYSTGASWSSDAGVWIGVGLLLVIVGVAVAAGGGGGSSSGGGTYYCTDTYVCDYVCQYDYYYGQVCFNDCYWTCY